MKTLVPLLLALLFTLSLASCGGGGGGSNPPPPPPPPPITDTDGDGVNDNQDAFPSDPTEWLDTDGDGVGNNSDAFPNDPAETLDSDGDGHGNNADAFPNDPAEWLDSDSDGVGNNLDACPLDPKGYIDTDGDGVCDYADSPQTPFISGIQVYGEAPKPTGSATEIAMVSYNNVVTPGSTLSLRVDINGSAADVAEVIITKPGAADHTALSISLAIETGNNFITFTVTLSEALATGEALELEIGVVNYSGNVSEYHHVSPQLSADEQYAITSYSGDSEFDVSGSWDATVTVIEHNPLIEVGTKIHNQLALGQSGNELIISNGENFYNGTISGNNQFVTMTFEGIMDFTSQGLDLYADFRETFSGEIVGANEIRGESNSVITKIYGNDADKYIIYSLKSSLVMTRDDLFAPKDDDGGNTYLRATEISIGVSYNKEISSVTDRDWFVVTTKKGGTIHVTLTGLSDDLDIILSNLEKGMLSQSTALGTSDEKVSYFSNQAETYYIEISGFNGEVSQYTLEVTFDN